MYGAAASVAFLRNSSIVFGLYNGLIKSRGLNTGRGKYTHGFFFQSPKGGDIGCLLT